VEEPSACVAEMPGFLPVITQAVVLTGVSLEGSGVAAANLNQRMGEPAT
jgi:hypothetical protein